MGKAAPSPSPMPMPSVRREESEFSYSFGETAGYGFGYSRPSVSLHQSSYSAPRVSCSYSDEPMIGPIGYMMLGGMLFGGD